ncbi:MAG: McrB family protein [Thermomicrobiales bacterium]
MAVQQDSSAVYEVANLFRQRCLVEGTSLLWPEYSAWTPENLDRFWQAFVGHPDEDKNLTFFEKLRKQLADEPLDVHRIAADVTVLYYLFPSTISRAKKQESVEKVISWKLGSQESSTEWALVGTAFDHGLGSAGMFYSTGMPWQVAFFLKFSMNLKAAEISSIDATACQNLANESLKEIPFNAISAKHILLHLLFPDSYEPIASTDHKMKIRAAFATLANVDITNDLDADLLKIRHWLAADLGRPEFNFYDPDINPQWNIPKPSPAPITPSPLPVVPVEDEERCEVPPSSIPLIIETFTVNDLVKKTNLDRSDVHEIESLLCEKRQIIFEGPPGSGKTFVAEQFARWFTSSDQDPSRVEIVQFHQSFGYEDFVQGIRPETNDSGQLSYHVRDGIFKQLCQTAANRPEERFVLIIDEINRGNISRIFGELLLLLEYREKQVRLPYGGNRLSIPTNLYLIGTMNSADRSLAQVDYALRRRFYFFRFMPVVNGRADILDRWLQSQYISDESRQQILQLFVSLNSALQAQLSADFQIGHSYFMVSGIDQPATIDRIWRHAVRPLLEEYFLHHRDKEDILAGLMPDRLLTSPAGVAPNQNQS